MFLPAARVFSALKRAAASDFFVVPHHFLTFIIPFFFSYDFLSFFLLLFGHEFSSISSLCCGLLFSLVITPFWSMPPY